MVREKDLNNSILCVQGNETGRWWTEYKVLGGEALVGSVSLEHLELELCCWESPAEHCLARCLDGTHCILHYDSDESKQ